MNSPALNWQSIEHSLKTLLHEWLTAYFDGAPHVLYQAATPVAFPLVTVSFGPGPVRAPLLRSILLATRSRTAGVATLTTSAAHGLTTGTLVRLSGVSDLDDSYDTATPKAVTVIDATTFRVSNARYDEAATASTGTAWTGPEADIRVVLHPGVRRQSLRPPLAGAAAGVASARDIQQSLLIDFWILAAVSDGQSLAPGGNSAGVCLRVSDLLQALMETAPAVADLSEKGVTSLRCRLAQEVPQAEHSARVVNAAATLLYAAG